MPDLDTVARAQAHAEHALDDARTGRRSPPPAENTASAPLRSAHISADAIFPPHSRCPRAAGRRCRAQSRANSRSSASSRAATGLGARGQIAQKREHALGRAGHLGRQRFLGRIGEAEQARGLVAQREDFLDARGVVESARHADPDPRRASDTRDRRVRASRAIVGIGQHRLHARLLQRDQPAVMARFLRVLRAAGAMSASGIPASRRASAMRSVHASVASSTAFSNSVDSRDSCVRDLAEARARRFLERDAGQTEIAQRMLDQRARRRAARQRNPARRRPPSPPRTARDSGRVRSRAR